MRATQNNVASASDGQVEALDDLIFWTDLSKANKLLNVNNAPVPIEADQNVNYILALEIIVWHRILTKT